MSVSTHAWIHADVHFTVGGRDARARPAEWSDVELLRRWKNAMRHAFFHKDVISAEAQQAWFQAFSARTDARMFVLEIGGCAVGCVGFRAAGPATVELFNLILGEPTLARSGVMSEFHRALAEELARHGIERIVLVVLRDNTPAIAFYERLGYVEAAHDAPAGSRPMELQLA
jgi:RimJ/RimL family protein N-acetyltransferase